MGRLPEEIVREPSVAAGADQELRVVHARRVQASPELLLRRAAEGLRRMTDLRPSPIVEGDEEGDAAVLRGQLLRPLHLLDQAGRHRPTTVADEPKLHS